VDGTGNGVKMRKGIRFGVASLAVAGIAAAACGTELPEAAADVLGTGRVIVAYSATGRAQLDAAIAALKDALGVPATLDETRERDVDTFPIDPERKDLVITLSRCYFTLGVVFAKGEDGEEDVYRKGKHWGLKGLRMNPTFVELEDREGFVDAVRRETDVDALYWACMNWVSVANFDRLAAIPAGIVGKTIAMLERVVELDETYDDYGAYRVLGSIWGALPRLPFGTYRKDLERARGYFCHVIDDSDLCDDGPPCAVDPACAEHLGNRRAFAEFYLIERRMWEKAAEVLQAVLDAPIGETDPLFNARAQDDARELLAQVQRRL